MRYDRVLRERAVCYREKHSQKETCQTFGISSSALKVWQKQYIEPGSLENKPLERTWRKIDPEKLRADVPAHPDDCNNARAQRFSCSGGAIRQALQKLNITRKKRALPTAKSPKKNDRNM